MKKIFNILFLMMPFAVFAQSNIAQYNLDVKIVGLHSNNGSILLEVTQSNDSVYKKQEGSIAKNVCTIHIDSVPKGEYMVQYYHDANSNKKMDSNFIGIPKEGYGFSNNPDSKYGPPPIEKMLFTMTTDTLIVINNVQW